MIGVGPRPRTTHRPSVLTGSLAAFSFSVSTTQPTSDFTWSVPDPGDGETYDYELIRQSDDTVVDTITGATGSASSTYTPTGNIGDTIDYRVRKVQGSQFKLSDNTETITIEEGPDPVTDLSASASSGQVDLSWTADDTQQNDLQTYEVHRSTTQGFDPSAGDATKIDDVTSFTEGASVSYSDTTVSNGTTYYYEVIGVDADGFTADSNEASATPSSVTNVQVIGFYA